MKLSGAAWSFVGATLAESRDIYRALGVGTLDLLASPGFLLDTDEIIRNPEQAAQPLRELGVPIGNLMFNFAPNFHDRAINHKDPTVRRRNAEEFVSVTEFCGRCGIPSITVLPGVEQEGWLSERSRTTAAEALSELAAIAVKKGIVLLFEPHVGSILESPAVVLAFLPAAPTLKVTLDYSHFIYQGHAQNDIDALAPYAGHVHLRQGAQNVLQARWAGGVIDFANVIRVLKSVGYQGYVTLEYEHDPWLGNDRVDVITETIKMRNLVQPLLG